MKKNKVEVNRSAQIRRVLALRSDLQEESKAVGWRQRVSLCLFRLVAQGEAGRRSQGYNHTSGLGFLLKCIKKKT